MNTAPQPPPRIASPLSSRLRLFLIIGGIAVVLLGVANFLALRWMRRINHSGEVVASYRADFQGGHPKPGWRYLWNPRGPLGDANSYAELEWSETRPGTYTSDAKAPFPAPAPARFLRVTATGGHPGQGPWQSRMDQELNAIFAFTVPSPGNYRLTQSLLVRVAGSKAGLLHLQVYVNERKAGSDIFCRSSEGVSFDRDLETLAAGDVIYVAVGPGEVDGEDAFEIDFSIAR